MVPTPPFAPATAITRPPREADLLRSDSGVGQGGAYGVVPLDQAGQPMVQVLQTERMGQHAARA